MKWVLTQEGQEIVNLDNCIQIECGYDYIDPDSDIKSFIIYAYSENGRIELGRYHNEEEQLSAFGKIQMDIRFGYAIIQVSHCYCDECQGEADV